MFLICGVEEDLRFPWTARRSNQSILNEINSEYSLEGIMLKLQYFSHLMQRADSPEKTLMLWKIEGRRRRGWQRMKYLDIITDSMDIEFEQIPGDSEGEGSLVCSRLWGSQRVRHDWAIEQQPIWDAYLIVKWKCYIHNYIISWMLRSREFGLEI